MTGDSVITHDLAVGELAKLEKKYKHKCPPWCHRCPLMGGGIMPNCWGCVGVGKRISDCHCDKPKARKQMADTSELEDRVKHLERLVGELQTKILQHQDRYHGTSGKLEIIRRPTSS